MVNDSTYGVLNTRNFQQLIDDCGTDQSLRSEVVSSLRTSVLNFLLTYFNIHPALEQHITEMTGTDIWGSAVATALERGYPIKADIGDPSRLEFGYDKIKVVFDIILRHYPNCVFEIGASIIFTW